MPDHALSSDPAVQAQLDRLTMLSPGRDVLGLERITALLARLGDPQNGLPPVFHVAGTNGKGSTCAYLRSAMEAAGRTVHVYTSPHLQRFNERIRLAGRLIDDSALAPLLAEVLDSSEGINPSFFEATTAAAFLAFSRTPADATIVEVGLGGRLDATNVIERPLICGIAQIGIDHQAFLLDPNNGPDWPPIERIAWEKAGIAKAGVPIVALDQRGEAEARIDEAAATAGTRALIASRDWHYALDGGALTVTDVRVPRPGMAGRHQHRNLALAIAMLRNQHAFALPAKALETAATATRWPARLQRLAPGPLAGHREAWLDGAHNEAAGESISAFVETLARPVHLITGILANKDASGLLAHFAGKVDRLTAIPVPGHAHHQPHDLAAIGETFGIPSGTADDARAAMGLQVEGTTLFMVSLYLAGEILRLNGETIT